MKEIKAQSYSEAEELLNQLPGFTSKNPFEQTKKFYLFLQREISERQLGKIVHIAGTNGKGSVCAFLQQIFLESGYHVGMFVSPHLITTRERFAIDGEIVSEGQFVEAFNWLSDRLEEYRLERGGYAPTYFERLFFMGMYLFAGAGVDVTILETGLGGRLDTTNVVQNPALCVITEIGLDHTEYLGDTAEKIAEEKAGIIKPGVPVVFLDKKKSVSRVLEEKASQKHSKCHIVSENEYKINEITKKSIDFSVFSRYYDYGRLLVHTSALYQVQNAAVAVRVCEALKRECGFDRLTLRSVKSGIEKMHWAGRMEELAPGVYIDGAHNEDGIEAFVHSLESTADLRRCIIVFSVMKDKRYDKMTELLCRLDAAEFIVTHIPGERGAELLALAKLFRRHTDKKVRAIGRIEDAVLYCMEKHEKEGCEVYITGSLYLAGTVRALVGGKCDDRF